MLEVLYYGCSNLTSPPLPSTITNLYHAFGFGPNTVGNLSGSIVIPPATTQMYHILLIAKIMWEIYLFFLYMM